jgi:hypothetical protein
VTYPTVDEIVSRYSGLEDVDADDLEALRQEYIDWIEGPNGKGVAYEVRTVTETVVVVTLSPYLPVSHGQLGAATSISITNDITGAAVTTPNVALLKPDGRRYRWQGDLFRPGQRVVIGYPHGHADTPPGVARGCRLFVRNEAMEEKSSNPANANRITNEASGFSYALTTVDMAAGRPTRWLDVMAAIAPVPDECAVLVA